MAEDFEILENEFSPPVDSALIHAIYHDFVGEPDGLNKAREALEALKQSAIAEQSTDFDPSGSSGRALHSSPHGQSSEAEDWTSETTATETTNLSNDVSALSLGERSGSGSDLSEDGRGYFTRAGQLDTPTKELLLAETFPKLRFELVVFTLKKCNNDFERATDELLNQVYFEDSRSSGIDEEAPIPKGIDGYDERHQGPVRKKGKNKRKQNRLLLHSQGSSSTPASDASLSPTTNKWEEGNRDVGLIARWTKLPIATVSSIYHKNGASLKATINTLLEKDTAAQKGEEPDAGLVGKAVDLTAKYPALDFDHAVSIIRLTAPSLVSADELSHAFTTTHWGKTTRSKLDVVPIYSPVNLSDNDDDASSTPVSTDLPILDPTATPHTTQSLHSARNTAFTQASQAYRRGKSDRHMRGVAGYYAQMGRDFHANLKSSSEADADALVAAQSTPTRLDLHGVTVQSATRIAKSKVSSWWEGLGEERIPGGGRGGGVKSGYTIVTGLGRHSEGGKGKIGPAVVRMLVREGWKVEVSGGEVVVTGRQRRN